MKVIEVKAGHRTRIIHMFSNSIPMEMGFTAHSIKKGGKVSGKVEVKGSNWLFPKAAIKQDLGDENIVKKGMWDTFYAVYVTPEDDVRIETKTTGGVQIWMLLIVAIVVLAVASSLFFS